MMNKTPKCSIIIPIYNVESYLRECIDSVLAQTYSDYELILVDDGSPDNCPAICDEYAEKDSRIRVIHKKNGGLSDARNAGLNIAAGKYILFLDSDDSVKTDLLEKTISRMDDGYDMVVFRYQYTYPDGRIQPGRSLEKENYVMESEADRLRFIHEVLLPCKIGWEAWSRVFRRDLVERYGLRFEDNKKIFAEDLYFSLCYCAHIDHIACINEILHDYRQRENSIMGVQMKRSNVGRINELGKAVLRHYEAFEDCACLRENYSVIHFQIVVGQFLFQLWISGIEPLEFQKMTRETVVDWDFLEQNVWEVLRQKQLWQTVGSVAYALELKSHAYFLLGGSWQKLRIQCKLIRILRSLMDFYGKVISGIL